MKKLQMAKSHVTKRGRIGLKGIVSLKNLRWGGGLWGESIVETGKGPTNHILKKERAIQRVRGSQIDRVVKEKDKGVFQMQETR